MDTASLLSLPDEIVAHICTLLPAESVTALDGTCRALHTVCRSQHLWQTLMRRDWCPSEAEMQQTRDFRKMYIEYASPRVYTHGHWFVYMKGSWLACGCAHPDQMSSCVLLLRRDVSLGPLVWTGFDYEANMYEGRPTGEWAVVSVDICQHISKVELQYLRAVMCAASPTDVSRASATFLASRRAAASGGDSALAEAVPQSLVQAVRRARRLAMPLQFGPWRLEQTTCFTYPEAARVRDTTGRWQCSFDIVPKSNSWMCMHPGPRRSGVVMFTGQGLAREMRFHFDPCPQ